MASMTTGTYPPTIVLHIGWWFLVGIGAVYFAVCLVAGVMVVGSDLAAWWKRRRAVRP